MDNLVVILIADLLAYGILWDYEGPVLTVV